MLNNQDLIKLFPDKEIRTYIFEANGLDFNIDEEPVNLTLQKYYLAFHNLLNLAFVYAFSCFETVVNFNSRSEYSLEYYLENGNSNSRRVLNTMRKIYKDCSLSTELIQFILMDIYFDYRMGEESRLSDLIPYFFSNKKVNLAEIFTWVNNSMFSSRYEACTLEYAENTFRELCLAMPFLKTTKLVYDDKCDWYYFETDRSKTFTLGKIYTFGLVDKIAHNPKRSYFYYVSEINLNTIKYEDVSQSRFCICKLSGVIGPNNRSVSNGILKPYVINRDVESFISYLNPDIQYDVKKSDNVELVIKQIYQVNYKYVKNLGLALADAVTRDSYSDKIDDLTEALKNLYPELFKEKERDWDTIFTMLLIELGPSKVLETIFSVIENIGFRICANLINRFGDVIADKFGTKLEKANDFDQLVEMRLQQFIKATGLVDSEKIRKRLSVEIKVKIILTAIVKAMGEDKETAYSEKGVHRYASILDNDEEDKLDDNYVISVFKLFLKKIICFYEGLFAYSKEKSAIDARNRILSTNELKQIKNNCEEKFKDAAIHKFNEIKDIDGCGQLLRMFINLAKECYFEDGNNYNTDASKDLYLLLGRRYVFDVESWMKESEENGIDVNIDDDKWWAKKAIPVMRYFTTGRFDKHNHEANLFKAVYPIVGNYYKLSKNQDDYDTAMFSLEIDANQNGSGDFFNTVGFLSEFEFRLNKQYYCLPNVLRSTKKRWIDPFTIECGIFDDIFEEAELEE